MNDIRIFENSEFGKLRVQLIDGEPWFVATDVCKALDLTNSRESLKRLDEDEKGVSSTDTLGGKQKLAIVNEPGFYTLVLSSRKPEAKQFKRWVTHEVLPTIRKHGAYINPALLEELRNSNQKTNDLLEALTSEVRKRENLQKENELLLPKAKYCDLILQNSAAVPVTLIAKDYGMSAVRFNAMLNELGIQYCVGGTWELYQDFTGNGYTHGNVHISKSGHPKMHTCWTQKGRMFLYDYLKRFNIIPAIEKV